MKVNNYSHCRDNKLVRLKWSRVKNVLIMQALKFHGITNINEKSLIFSVVVSYRGKMSKEASLNEYF